MKANETGSQLRTSQGFNCFGSSWSESFSKHAASLQTVILHRWGIKCWFRKAGFITEPTSLLNYIFLNWAHFSPITTINPGPKCGKLAFLHINIIRFNWDWTHGYVTCLIQVSGWIYVRPSNQTTSLTGRIVSLSIYSLSFYVILQVRQRCKNGNLSPGSWREAPKAILYFYTHTEF